MILGPIDGAEDLREQPDAVAHRDSVLGLPVVTLEIALAVARRRRVGASIVEIGRSGGDDIQFRRLVDDPEPRVTPLPILEKLDEHPPVRPVGAGESQAGAFDGGVL